MPMASTTDATSTSRRRRLRKDCLPLKMPTDSRNSWKSPEMTIDQYGQHSWICQPLMRVTALFSLLDPKELHLECGLWLLSQPSPWASGDSAHPDLVSSRDMAGTTRLLMLGFPRKHRHGRLFAGGWTRLASGGDPKADCSTNICSIRSLHVLRGRRGCPTPVGSSS